MVQNSQLGDMGISGPAGMSPRGGPTIYHLADIHLGGAFPFLGAGGSAHRSQLREAFVRTVDQGLQFAPSVVLITGNLLGTPFPSRELSEFVRAQVARFSQTGIPVLIAAGPLDAMYDKNYAAGALAELDRVTVFPTSPKVVMLRDLEMAVVGTSWGSSTVQADVFAGFPSQRPSRHVIGAFCIPWPDSEEGLKALRRQIAATGASYLALGGSSIRRDLTTEMVAAWCPGSPELVAPDEGEGSPLLIRLGDAVEVTARPVARRRYARFTLQPAAYPTPQDLGEAIRALGGPDLAAQVRLVGNSRIDQFIDVADLRERLAPEFLALEIVDESRPAVEDLNAATYPELSVAGKFVKVVRAEMERATTEEARRRAGAALRLGLSLLEGRRPA
jgi:hypothetical protein